jgi:hypothetical protein
MTPREDVTYQTYQKVDAMKPAILRLINIISTYLPLALTVVLLIATTFDSDLLRYIPIELMLATIALSFILISVHVETKMAQSTKKLNELESSISALQGVQKSFLDTVRPTIQTMSLAQSLHAVANFKREWRSLQVYAISSHQIVTFFRAHGIKVENCELLIHDTPAARTARSPGKQGIPFYIQDWRSLKADGFIGKLTIRSYDFLPTEFECIFDDEVLILGMYQLAPEDYSSVRVRNVTLVLNTATEGQRMIDEYSDRYRKLFEVCASHYGPNRYEN